MCMFLRRVACVNALGVCAYPLFVGTGKADRSAI